MTKIVILGSCRFEPYEILAVPNKIPNAWNTEKGYKKAAEKFHPAIEQADCIIVFAPDGIGKHTQRDIDYAMAHGKYVFFAGFSKMDNTHINSGEQKSEENK
jgi:ketol-acid reductoisomerase